MAQVSIDVNGRQYVVGCEDGQEGRLRELAKTFDAIVREVSAEVGSLGETRLMLMSALMMADDLKETKAKVIQLGAEITRMQADQSRIELKAVAAIEAAAQKIEKLAAD